MEKDKNILWDVKDLYKTRFVVFLEQEPLTNKYRQVVFSPDQFKKLVFFINSLFPTIPNTHNGHPAVKMLISEKPPILLPEHLRDYYKTGE